MNFLLAVICLVIGVWVLIDPDKALRFEDLFRINGERVYSEFAIGIMRLRGLLSIVLGIVLLFMRF